MSSPKLIRIVHKNDLSAYLGDWKTSMNVMSDAIGRRVSKEEGERYHITRNPKPFESFSFNSHDLSLLFTYLDDRLGVIANFGEIGRLFGMKTAGCSEQIGHPLAAPD